MKKHISIKVYGSHDNFQAVWEDFEFNGFSKEINGGLGQCTIMLGKKFDYTGGDLEINNEVQIFVTDKETMDSNDHDLLIYDGYISQIKRQAINEKIEVTLLGYYTKLAQDIYKIGDLTTFHPVADAGTIFRNIMTSYNDETSNRKLNWTHESIQSTYTGSVSYVFEAMTCRKSIDKVLDMSPTGWYWYVNAANFVRFQSKALKPIKSHSFVFGKHFKNVKVTKSIEKIRNALLFWNGIVGVGEIYKLYSNAESILKHERRVEKVTDSRVGSESTADVIGNRFVNLHKDPAIAVEVEIIDSNIADENKMVGYDIETIDPGDICNFHGFNESLSDIFYEDMMITKVDYKLDRAIITVEPMGSGVVTRQEHIATNVDELSNSGAPTNYTT